MVGPMLTVYTYAQCSTCRRATAWLRAQGIPFVEKPIRETPPTRAELRQALASGLTVRALFNTSGQDYREKDLKTRLPQLSEDEALALLSGCGNLVKRPFVVGGTRTLVGFAPERWATELLA